MKKIEILVICTHTEILATIVRLINKDPEMQATPSLTASNTLALFKAKVFDLVLLGAGLPEKEEVELIKNLKKISPETPVIEHYGGGSGLLFTEIRQALHG